MQCEEALDWFRHPTDQELDDFEYVVGLDINFAFTHAARGIKVGYGPVSPTPEHRPAFDAAVPGCWYVDLTHMPTNPRLPSPFTPTGAPPTGPAWYATPTLAYAQRQLRATIEPIKAYLRRGPSGPYLEGWTGPSEPVPELPADLRMLAVDALDQVVCDRSELAEQWAEAANWSKWRQEITRLRDLLDPPIPPQEEALFEI
ncbi:DUF4259 domain-containing protein [Streptomyces sp. NRRL S-378]|uniref:DUF4259 domain-containing protein n=1 Tax=Streptomyces sp. NRRL S-378 TaxID=1463904 RepID=UPI00068AB989|nr:DUF4259 domain-containing protein [Streptomyces sp. NRRL S-378]